MLLDHVHSAAASGFKTASQPELRLGRGTRYGGSAPASQSALTFHVGPEFALGRNCPTTNGGGRFQRALSESWGSPVVSNGLGRVSNGICLRPRGMHEPQASDPQIVHCNNMPKYHSRRLSSSVRIGAALEVGRDQTGADWYVFGVTIVVIEHAMYEVSRVIDQDGRSGHASFTDLIALYFGRILLRRCS